jgi:hypothetical protein
MADDAMELLTAERPKLVSGNKATYGPGTIRLSEDAVINIKNRSFSLVAEIDIADGEVEGTLVTLGGETGGYAFVVVDGKPTFHYNFLGQERSTITSTEPLPKGATARFDFAYDGGGPGKGGTGTLSINGKQVGERQNRENRARLLLHRRHLRRGRGLGHAGVAKLQDPIQIHRHTEDRHSRSPLTALPPDLGAAG